MYSATNYATQWTYLSDSINGLLATWSNTHLDTIITIGDNSITVDTNWSAPTTIANSNGIAFVGEKPQPVTATLTAGLYAIYLYLDDGKFKIGVSLTSGSYGIGVDTYTLRIIRVYSATNYATQWTYLSDNGQLIAFGDSTTYGVIGGSSGLSEYNYPTAIANALHMTSNNKAVAGQGLIKDWEQIISTVNRTDFTPYKLCTVAWSYNDYALYSGINLGTIGDETATTVLGYYRTILDTIQAKNVNMRVILITGYGYPDINNGEKMMEQPMPFKDGTITAREYYDKLEEMAIKHGYTCINQAKQPWLNLKNISLIGDNIHPTNNGYKVYSDYIVGRISSLFNPIN